MSIYLIFNYLIKKFSKKNFHLILTYFNLFFLRDEFDNIFFTSCKQNLGVRFCFNKIFNKINQREDLWKKDEFENDLSMNSKDEAEENKGIKGGLFSCCAKRKNEENNISKDGDLVIVEQMVDIDEDEEEDKYRKIIHKMTGKNTNKESNKEEKEKNNNKSNEENKDQDEGNKEKGGCLFI
jgi:hypothetical protein